jgi:hypothetical protein
MAGWCDATKLDATDLDATDLDATELDVLDVTAYVNVAPIRGIGTVSVSRSVLAWGRRDPAGRASDHE